MPQVTAVDGQFGTHRVQQRGEGLHSSVRGYVIQFDATLGQLFDISTRLKIYFRRRWTRVSLGELSGL